MNFIEEFYIDLDLCDDLIVYMERYGKKFAGISGNSIVDQFTKKSIDCKLNDDRLLDSYKQELKKCLDDYVSKYEHAKTPLTTDPYIIIQRYDPGDAYYRWHCERITANPAFSKRHLVFMTYLNDVTDQGETEFFYQKVKFKPKKGLTLIWPVDWTHTHRGIPSPTQTKYIITGWINFVT
jgi:hypothetical protein